MSAHNIEARVARVIAECGGLRQEAVKPESTLAQLGLDSLDELEILAQLQDEFSILFPDSAEGSTVAQLCAAVRSLTEVLA